MLSIVGVRALREIRGWTQAELATLAKVSRQTINRLESPRPVRKIRLDVLQRIAGAFGVHPGLFISEWHSPSTGVASATYHITVGR